MPPDSLIEVWTHLPAHRGLGQSLSYRYSHELKPGSLVRIPIGEQTQLGVVCASQTQAATQAQPDTFALKPIESILNSCPPLRSDWMSLVEFTAQYYRRSPGEVALMALPSLLKQSTQESFAKRMERLHKKVKPVEFAQTHAIASAKRLTQEQSDALSALLSHQSTSLLYGATGSGKTEVYLQCMHDVLEQEPNAQILVMVPEINLTPQLEQLIQARFSHLGPHAVVSLHSGLPPAQRLNHWLLAHLGLARIVLGTRLSVFASFAHLKLIVVDEEHDPSFKQADGPRHSARDLAVFRGHQLGIPVTLVSATPSFESWNKSTLRPHHKHDYLRVNMPSRQGNQPMPELVLMDMNRFDRKTWLHPLLEQAIATRIRLNEQVLLLLNRRGYAPVLFCPDCQWVSDCEHCSAHQVLHKSDQRLHCHHCGTQTRIPTSCPSCSGHQLMSLGQGTEQIEEALIQRLATWRRPDGQAVRVIRMDADTVRHKGQLHAQLGAFHQGQADVLVGTQMVAKGHDFRHVGLVAALNPDGALFSSDFRAPERLFALLMQAAGRAGRDPHRSNTTPTQMWIQTHYPDHHLFQHLKNFDFSGFAQDELMARKTIGLPPFVHQALLRIEAKKMEPTLVALAKQHPLCVHLVSELHLPVVVQHPVPMSMSKLAGVHRSQMLVESHSRQALLKFLQAWDDTLSKQLRQEKGLLRWAWDTDPTSI